MRALLAVAVIVLLLVAVGVMHFSKSDDQVNVTIETGKIEDAAEKAIETGKRAVQGAGDEIEDAAEELTDDAEPPDEAGQEDSKTTQERPEAEARQNSVDESARQK